MSLNASTEEKKRGNRLEGLYERDMIIELYLNELRATKTQQRKIH